MSDWMIWLIAAGLVVIFEIFIGTFYLLMISVGLAAGAAAAWFGMDISLQLIVAAIVGSIATYALRKSRLGSTQKLDVARDRNVLLDIGQTVTVNEWQAGGAGRSIARVMYRGAMWDFELEPDQPPKAGVFRINEIRGSRLIVAGVPE